MAFWSRFIGGAAAAPAPRAAVQSADGGVIISTAADLDEYLKSGNATRSGMRITPENALHEPVVFGCVRLISGSFANMPVDIKRKVDARTREDVESAHFLAKLMRKPNGFQKPQQFKRMAAVHVLLRGNFYALKVKSLGRTSALIPLHPDRVEPKLVDLKKVFEYRHPNGSLVTFQQDEIFHLFCLTLDGAKGVTPITYARETIGASLTMADHGSFTFRNGARTSGVLKHPNKLGKDGRANLRESLDEYRAGGEAEGKFLILEEGAELSGMKMSSVDAQWIEARGYTPTDVAMFYGVPPHMLGITDKVTSFGQGIDAQRDGFIAFSLEDYLTMFEEAVNADLSTEPDVYARINRNALVRGDIKARWASYTSSLQWGVHSPNEIRALEDENPREGGDIFYPPPNTAGDSKQDEKQNDDPQPAGR